MKLLHLHLVAALVSGLAIYGCGGDDDDTTSTGGTGAHAGTSTGGKAGRGGSSGKGGSAGKGAGGEGGNGATGGTTSTGGNGGESATTGTSGSGGEGGLIGAGGAAAVDVTGSWSVQETIPSGAVAGTYLATFTLKTLGNAVTGTALWDGGLASVLTGSVHGYKIHLDRTDPSGFHATFDGTVATSGASMSGTGKNDPASPGGNDATYTWTGTLNTGAGGAGGNGSGDAGAGGGGTPAN